MFAAIVITIAPLAGCSGGTSGKSRRISGRSAPAMSFTMPDRSASRMIPSQSVITPIRPSAMLTAVFDESSAPSVSSFIRPVQPPMATAISTSASQIVFSMAQCVKVSRHAGNAHFAAGVVWMMISINCRDCRLVPSDLFLDFSSLDGKFGRSVPALTVVPPV